MNSPESWQSEFEVLLASLVDGTLPIAKQGRLELLLSNRADARAFYLRFMRLHAQLVAVHVLCPPVGSGELRATAKNVVPRAGQRALPARSGSPSVRRSSSPVLLDWLVDLHRNVGDVFGRLGRPAVLASVAVSAALLMVLAHAMFSTREVGPEQARTERTTSVTVARLSRGVQCVWAGTDPAPAIGDTLPADRALVLKSGVAEIVFESGARVVLEGPARMQAISSKQLRLDAGRLVAQVPKQAIGFTVNTETATVVDLGTEFGVEVIENGPTEVQTFVGKVMLRAGATADRPGSEGPRTLVAGEAIRVISDKSKQRSTLQTVAIDARRFVRSLSSRGIQQLPVVGAAASSELDDTVGGAWCRVTNLINGKGLTNEAHSNNPRSTMWRSSPGKLKGEWVLFDLGRLCLLQSMKVWNYNEADLPSSLTLGVAQANVYVSATGKGDPVSQPDEWSLAVPGQRFEPGDGTDQYATPTAVPLARATARYVAIVIDSCHGSFDAQDARPEKQSVGLSEVQFIGEPVSLEESDAQTVQESKR